MTRDELPDYDYEVPKYTVTLQIQCDQHPSRWLLEHIYEYLEQGQDDDEYARILHIESYEDRPTTIEHHGGYPIPKRY